MRKITCFSLCLCLLLSVLAGCHKTPVVPVEPDVPVISNPSVTPEVPKDLQEPEKEPPLEAPLPTPTEYPYNTDGMYFYSKDGTVTFITQNGDPVAAQNPKNILITSGAAPGLGMDVLRENADPYCVVDYPVSTYPYIHAVTAPRDDAPGAMAAAVLDSHLNSGKPNALESYTLQKVTLNMVKDNRIDFTMTYDAVAAAYATAYSASTPYGSTQDRTMNNQTFRMTIYGGIDNLWLTNHTVELGRSSLKKATSSVYFPLETEEILYEGKGFTLVSGKDYLPQSKEDRDAGMPIEYNGTLFVYDHVTKTSTFLAENQKNTEFFLLQQAADNLYIGSKAWQYDEAGVTNSLICYSMQSKDALQLSYHEPLAIAPNAIYYTDYEQLYRLSLPDHQVQSIALPATIPYGFFAEKAGNHSLVLKVHHSYDNDISSAHLPFCTYVADFDAGTITAE